MGKVLALLPDQHIPHTVTAQPASSLTLTTTNVSLVQRTAQLPQEQLLSIIALAWLICTCLMENVYPVQKDRYPRPELKQFNTVLVRLTSIKMPEFVPLAQLDQLLHKVPHIFITVAVLLTTTKTKECA